MTSARELAVEFVRLLNERNFEGSRSVSYYDLCARDANDLDVVFERMLKNGLIFLKD